MESDSRDSELVRAEHRLASAGDSSVLVHYWLIQISRYRRLNPCEQHRLEELRRPHSNGKLKA